MARLLAALGPALAADTEPDPGRPRGLRKIPRGGLRASEAEVNGSPGMLIWAGGELFAVLVPVIDGGKITALYAIATPDKLAVAQRQARAS